MWHHDLFHKQNSLECSMCLLHQFWRGRGWWRRGCLNRSHNGAIPFWGEMGSTWNCTFNWGSDHSCMSKAKDFICVFTKRLTEITWEGFPVLKMSAQHPALQASPNIVDYFKSNSASFVLCSTVLDEEQWWGRTISFRRINSPFSPKQMISLSLIDVGGQSWMLVSSSGPSGLGALSLQRPPYGILPEGIRCCRIFRLRVGQGSLGCNYTCVWGGGGVRGVFWGERDWDDASISEGGPPPSTLTPIPQPLCLWLLTRVAPVPHLLLSPHARTIGWASVKNWMWRPPQSLQPNRLPELLPAISSHYIRSKAIS